MVYLLIILGRESQLVTDRNFSVWVYYTIMFLSCQMFIANTHQERILFFLNIYTIFTSFILYEINELPYKDI